MGGLIQAYKASAEATLNEATIVQYIQKTKYKIQFEYSQQGEVTKVLEHLNATIIDQSFTEKVSYTFEIPTKNVDEIEISFEPIQHLIEIKEI